MNDVIFFGPTPGLDVLQLDHTISSTKESAERDQLFSAPILSLMP